MTKMKVLVTGASGFIGSHLYRRLMMQGHQLVIVDLNVDVLDKASNLNVEAYKGSFADLTLMSKALSGVDVCIHLASSMLPASSNKAPVRDAEENLLGTLGLIDMANQCGVRHFVYASSGGTVYGNSLNSPFSESDFGHPVCSYGVVKKAIEDYLELYHHLYGLSYISLRLANPYGAGQNPLGVQGVIPIFIRHAIQKLPIQVWGDGTQLRDYIYIDDVINAFDLAVHAPAAKSGIYNIGSGVGASLNEVVQLIQQALSVSVDVVHLEKRKSDVDASVLNIDKAMSDLAWEPSVTLAQGINNTVEYVQKILNLDV